MRSAFPRVKLLTISSTLVEVEEVVHHPYSPDLAPGDFFFVSLTQKGHERKALFHCEKGKTKNTERPKDHFDK